MTDIFEHGYSVLIIERWCSSDHLKDQHTSGPPDESAQSFIIKLILRIMSLGYICATIIRKLQQIEFCGMDKELCAKRSTT